MPRVAPSLLIWPLVLLGTAAAIALSGSGLLSLVAAHASVPPPLHVKTTMPAPRLIPAAATPRPIAQPPRATPIVTEVVVARTPDAQVGPAGTTLRGAPGERALAVWELRPGSDLILLSRRAGWSEVNQDGLVGWVPTSALVK